MSRVLIADDEPPIREMIKITCEMDGHEVRTAVSAPQALEVYDDFAPDVVILDVNMPGGGGDHVVGELERRGASCPVIVVTGLGAALDEAQREQFGAAQVLSKPFNIEALRLAVRTALGS